MQQHTEHKLLKDDDFLCQGNNVKTTDLRHGCSKKVCASKVYIKRKILFYKQHRCVLPA